MVVETHYYDILRVSPDDDDDTIKKAYRYSTRVTPDKFLAVSSSYVCFLQEACHEVSPR